MKVNMPYTGPLTYAFTSLTSVDNMTQWHNTDCVQGINIDCYSYFDLVIAPWRTKLMVLTDYYVNHLSNISLNRAFYE